MQRMRIVLAAVFILSVVLSLIPIPFASAQEVTPSAGCAALNGTEVNVNPSPFDTPAAAFNEGEVIILKVTGSGTEFALTDSGASLTATALVGETIIFTIPADGTYAIGVAVEGTTDSTTLASFFCSVSGDYGEIDPDGDGKVEVCHYPPGNPGNAHTIRIGVAAVFAHLGHGDKLGRCPVDEESRDDNYEDGLVTFVDEINAIITVYGSCDDDDNCVLVLEIDLTILVAIEGAEFEFDSDYEYGPHAIVYYLGRSHLDETAHVFQVNFYDMWNNLLDDTLLIFTDDDGVVLGWDNRILNLQRTVLPF